MIDYGIIFLLLIIFILGILFLYYKITNTKWYRLKSIMKAQKLREKNSSDDLERLKKESNEFISDHNKLLEIIKKIRTGEEVQIPVVAFDYIYRNINKISVVGKDGKITIINQEDFKIFELKALELLNKNEEDIFSEENLIETDENINADFIHGPDGNVVKKQTAIRKVTFTSDDGTQYTNDPEKNLLEIIEPEKKEDQKNQKGFNERTNESEAKIRKLEKNLKDKETKINVLSHELQETNKKSKTDEDMQKETNKEKPELGQIKIDFTDTLNKYTPTDTKDKKTKKSTPVAAQKKEDEITESDKKDVKGDNSYLDKVIEQIDQLSNIDKENQILQKGFLDFEDSEIFFNRLLRETEPYKLLNYFFTIRNDIYDNHICYSESDDRIYISVPLALFKIYCLISEETRGVFLSAAIKSNGNTKEVFDSSLLMKFVIGINKKMAFTENAAKPFVFNEAKSMFYVEKYLSITENEDEPNKVYNGNFMICNINKDFGEKFKQSNSFKKIVLKIKTIDDKQPEDIENATNLTFKFLKKFGNENR